MGLLQSREGIQCHKEIREGLLVAGDLSAGDVNLGRRMRGKQC